MFDHTGYSLVCTMRDLKIGVFEHLEITLSLYVDKRINYTHPLLRGPVIKKYKTVRVECTELAKVISWYHWTLGARKYVTMEQFWNWENQDDINGSVHMYLGCDRCIDFDKYIWFELWNSMQKIYPNTVQDHVKYIHNDTVKPFRVDIIQYADRVCDMQELAKHLPPTLMKGRWFESANWSVRDK